LANQDPSPPVPQLADDWRTKAVLLHERGSVANADVYLVELDGKQVLAKTYSGNPFWARWLFGYLGLSRELKAMQALQGIPGVPAVFGIHQGTTLLMEYIQDGEPLVSHDELSPEEYPSLAFFGQLREIVGQMHSRGIAHGDMRRRNILRTGQDVPHLIDFTTAIHWRRFNPLARLLFHALRRADRFGVGKLQLSFYPDSLSPEEAQRILHKPWYLALGRFLRQRVYRKWIKQKRWRKRIETWRGVAGKQRE
jgi:tRNA A-37 threonylcarbamoyl transferase component Bud32